MDNVLAFLCGVFTGGVLTAMIGTFLTLQYNKKPKEFVFKTEGEPRLQTGLMCYCPACKEWSDIPDGQALVCPECGKDLGPGKYDDSDE